MGRWEDEREKNFGGKKKEKEGEGRKKMCMRANL